MNPRQKPESRKELMFTRTAQSGGSRCLSLLRVWKVHMSIERFGDEVVKARRVLCRVNDRKVLRTNPLTMLCCLGRWGEGEGVCVRVRVRVMGEG